MSLTWLTNSSTQAGSRTRKSQAKKPSTHFKQARPNLHNLSGGVPQEKLRLSPRIPPPVNLQACFSSEHALPAKIYSVLLELVRRSYGYSVMEQTSGCVAGTCDSCCSLARELGAKCLSERARPIEYEPMITLLKTITLHHAFLCLFSGFFPPPSSLPCPLILFRSYSLLVRVHHSHSHLWSAQALFTVKIYE